MPFPSSPVPADPAVCPSLCLSPSCALWHSRALTCLSLARLHCPALGLQARPPSVCQQTAAGTGEGGGTGQGGRAVLCQLGVLPALEPPSLPSPVPWHGGSQLCQGLCPLSFTTPGAMGGLSVCPPPSPHQSPVSPVSFTVSQSHSSSVSLCPPPPVTQALSPGLLPRGRGRWQRPDRAAPGG